MLVTILIMSEEKYDENSTERKMKMDIWTELRNKAQERRDAVYTDTKSTEKLLEQLEKPDLAGQLSF